MAVQGRERGGDLWVWAALAAIRDLLGGFRLDTGLVRAKGGVMDWSEVAPSAYEAYASGLGMDGLSWSDMPEAERQAWMSASRAAVEEYERQRILEPPPALELMDRIEAAIKDATTATHFRLGPDVNLAAQHPLILIRDLARAVLGSAKASP